VLVKDILVQRLITIPHNASMADAERMLKEAHIRHLPVTNGKDIVGIISDRDIQRARTVIRTEENNQTLIQSYKKVSDYMASPVKTMRINDTLENLTREMIRQKISSFIILDADSAPAGIITTEDLLLVLLEKLEAGASGKIFRKFLKGFRN
jgi:acetoin utilization protein AcuB